MRSMMLVFMLCVGFMTACGGSDSSQSGGSGFSSDRSDSDWRADVVRGASHKADTWTVHVYLRSSEIESNTCDSYVRQSLDVDGEDEAIEEMNRLRNIYQRGRQEFQFPCYDISGSFIRKVPDYVYVFALDTLGNPLEPFGPAF